VLRDRYGIEHTTLQMEEDADDDALLQVDSEPHWARGRKWQLRR
jgi:hypothetical protein